MGGFVHDSVNGERQNPPSPGGSFYARGRLPALQTVTATSLARAGYSETRLRQPLARKNTPGRAEVRATQPGQAGWSQRYFSSLASDQASTVLSAMPHSSCFWSRLSAIVCGSLSNAVSRFCSLSSWS